MNVTPLATFLPPFPAKRLPRRRFASSFATIALVTVCTAIPARASLLSEWNLLVETNMSTSSHVDGSTKVGGNMTAAAGEFTTHEVTALDGDGLAVGGNISGSFHINNGGNLRLGGTNSASVVYNGGGHFISDGGVAADVASDFAYLDTLSGMYAGLTPNGTLAGNGDMTASPTLIDGQMVAVYNLTAGSFGGLGQLNLVIGSADTVVINVSGANVNFQSPPNMIGGFSQTNSTKILWNLPGATQVTVNNSFSGALLGAVCRSEPDRRRHERHGGRAFDLESERRDPQLHVHRVRSRTRAGQRSASRHRCDRAGVVWPAAPQVVYRHSSEVGTAQAGPARAAAIRVGRPLPERYNRPQRILPRACECAEE